MYNQLMKEMSHDQNSGSISYENLSLLLFMTQKAISDLKLLKSLFYHRKFTGGFGRGATDVGGGFSWNPGTGFRWPSSREQLRERYNH